MTMIQINEFTNQPELEQTTCWQYYNVSVDVVNPLFVKYHKYKFIYYWVGFSGAGSL